MNQVQAAQFTITVLTSIHFDKKFKSIDVGFWFGHLKN